MGTPSRWERHCIRYPKTQGWGGVGWKMVPMAACTNSMWGSHSTELQSASRSSATGSTAMPCKWEGRFSLRDPINQLIPWASRIPIKGPISKKTKNRASWKSLCNLLTAGCKLHLPRFTINGRYRKTEPVHGWTFWKRFGCIRPEPEPNLNLLQKVRTSVRYGSCSLVK